jgi:hypothetical protein
MRGDFHSTGIRKLARPSAPQDPLCGRDVPKTQGKQGAGPATLAKPILYQDHRLARSSGSRYRSLGRGRSLGTNSLSRLEFLTGKRLTPEIIEEAARLASEQAECLSDH